MRFSLQHLIAFVTLFALSLASGIPGAHMLPDGVWQVISLHEEENGVMWHGTDPGTGEPSGDLGMDYMIKIRDGFRTRTVNLGETNVVWDHQLPSIGGYVVVRESKTDTHGTLPITVLDQLPRYTLALSLTLSLAISLLIVVSASMVRGWLASSRRGTIQVQ